MTSQNSPGTDTGATRSAICIELGRNLKRLRIAAGKSQETVAVEAEIDRTFVSAIERGIANPSVITLSNLSYVLGVTLGELFGAELLSSKPEPAHRRLNAAKPVAKIKGSRLR
jgi:transcriptional regulator with XRE-family HTH domain